MVQRSAEYPNLQNQWRRHGVYRRHHLLQYICDVLNGDELVSHSITDRPSIQESISFTNTRTILYTDARSNNNLSHRNTNRSTLYHSDPCAISISDDCCAHSISLHTVSHCKTNHWKSN